MAHQDGVAVEAARRPRAGAAQIAITAAILFLQLTLAQIAASVVGLTAISAVASCDSGDCDPRWAEWAMEATLYGGGALLVVTTAIAIWRLVRAKQSVRVAITGCVLQVLLALAAAMMVGITGPVSF
ncbi:hypothetical protein O6P37_03335 [Mycobacterium sp. CPCC 205372]|uniref:Transmembrane protein n=1 Tax=Mycobacterium hippophais TaxID=3016340 RepID=A0ABT4PMU8_9MYCO|nr:hypothetical protein [Mycobacterium hippophais]MCZ8377887.1 hypothetical protein [Mycobacterium hippophais]